MNLGKVRGLFARGGLLGVLLLSACADDDASPFSPNPIPETQELCSISQNLIFDGGPGKDGIQALTNPSFVPVGGPGTDYLKDDDRVVGMILGPGPMAIPLNIFWWHEIVNLDGVGGTYAITHCPLTGSSLGFERDAAGGAEFGVSGLLYKNNLIMYDRNGDESLWPQMLRGARCGTRDGATLPMVPIFEMTWEGWRTLYPETLVVSDDTGFSPNYTRYPYGGYDFLDNSSTLFPATIDDRRPPKERVLGIPFESGGLAFPFGLLDELGASAAVSAELAGVGLVVFWDRLRQSAMAYKRILNDEFLTFSAVNGRITDEQTGSIWGVDGLATDGPLAGQRLRPVAEAFVAFWFAWPEFYPEIKVWTENRDG